MGIMSFVSKGIKTKKKEEIERVTLEPPADFASAQAFEGVGVSEALLDSNSAFINSYGNAFTGATLGNRNILVISPNTNQDVNQIVENLQSGEACVINLENIPVADAQRRLDFLSGVICAMNGSIKPLDAHKYILTPQGLGVRN